MSAKIKYNNINKIQSEMNYFYSPNEKNDTIAAISTAKGTGAIAIIRISGADAFKICDKIFFPLNKKFILSQAKSYTIHFGTIRKNNEILDEVLLSIFKAPNTYTSEDIIEISCHGSVFIQQKILELLIENGARLAKAGEFTLRAFLNGKFDLSQAEAVADMISSNSKTSHELALKQMRGGFSQKIKELRKELVDFTSLIELELDFSEEEVEFADRKNLIKLLNRIKTETSTLIESFSLGNVLKHGIPVAIIGEPNVGKSTLLNALLNEDRAIVSEIPGTTRDSIEDTINLDNINFRFIDTAGLRDSEDEIENLGIEKTYDKISQARIILFVIDISKTTCDDIEKSLKDFKNYIENKLPEKSRESKKFIIVANKTDLLIESPKGLKELFDMECIFVSAKRKQNVNLIIESLLKSVEIENITDGSLVSNARHYEALCKSFEAVENIEKGINTNVPTDLVAIDIRTALHHLGEITGEITTDEILGNIFGKFCVGK